MDSIRVALVDDQALVRKGYQMVIDSQDDMAVVLEASHGEQALARLELVPVDIILMDVRMPIMDGLAATEQIASRSWHGLDPKIIILTTYDLDEYALRAVRGGASGFLLKDATPPELLSAIRTVHRGDAVIAPSTTRRLLAHLAHEAAEPSTCAADRLDVLTNREREVLIQAAKGLTNQEIADTLYVAEATVKTHIGRIFAKLGVRDRVQAVVLAYECGLVRPGE